MPLLIDPSTLAGRLLAICGTALGVVTFVHGAESGELTATSRIDAVTVFPSGAEVTRLAKLRIPKGEHVVVIADVTAAAVPQSIRVDGKGTAQIEIGSIDTRQLSVPHTDPKAAATERRRLELAIEQARDERALIEAAKAAAEVQRKLVTNLAELPLRLPAHNGTGAATFPDWSALASMVGQRHAEAAKAIEEAKVRLRTADRRISDLEGKLAALAPVETERTEVRVNLVAAADGESELVLRYQVATAAWIPSYDARLSTGEKGQKPALALTRRAAISQESGEAWLGVALTLSTTRPHGGTEAPRLPPQLVDLQPVAPPQPPPRPASAPMTGRARSAPAAEAFADAAKPTGGVSGARPVRQAAAKHRRAAVDLAPFQALYIVPGRIDVPDTGDAKRAVIDLTTLEPKLLVRTVPRRAASAYLNAEFFAPAGAPLLAGQASLFRDGTFVGSGRLPLLPAGERHELGFGLDDAVKVRFATLEEKRGETGIISSSKTERRNYRISVKNHHRQPIELMVIDHVPTSLDQDVQVEATSKPQPTKRDLEEQRGVLAWKSTVAADGEQVIEHGWRITWPAARQLRYR